MRYGGSMAARRDPLVDGVRFVSDVNQIEMTAPMAHVLLVRFQGDVTDELAQALRTELPAFALQHAPAELFLDQLEARNVPTAFRKEMVSILANMSQQLTKFHVLSNKTLLTMLVATANLLLRNRLQSYSDRRRFEEEMRRVGGSG